MIALLGSEALKYRGKRGVALAAQPPRHLRIAGRRLVLHRVGDGEKLLD